MKGIDAQIDKIEEKSAPNPDRNRETAEPRCENLKKKYKNQFVVVPRF